MGADVLPMRPAEAEKQSPTHPKEQVAGGSLPPPRVPTLPTFSLPPSICHDHSGRGEGWGMQNADGPPKGTAAAPEKEVLAPPHVNLTQIGLSCGSWLVSGPLCTFPLENESEQESKQASDLTYLQVGQRRAPLRKEHGYRGSGQRRASKYVLELPRAYLGLLEQSSFPSLLPSH